MLLTAPTRSSHAAGCAAISSTATSGIKRATGGKVVAHVIRARPQKAPHGEWHAHDCKLQFVYVLKGWALFEYEGVGKVMMKAEAASTSRPASATARSGTRRISS